MNNTHPIDAVTFYRHGTAWCYAAWCYAAWCRGEFDHSDPIDVLDSATDEEARAEIGRMFPGATVTRVEDMN